jgi:autotransporter-associated beta strand protein
VGVAADQLTLSGAISGTNGLTKVGAGKLVLGNANNSFTGNFTVAGGSLDTGTAQGGGVNGYFGAVNGTRTITVQTGATLNFLANNQFGGGGKTVFDIPSVVLNGGTLNSTRFNILGNVTLNNGGTLTQSTTDSGSYEGYEFLGGTVTVSGTGTATISSDNGRFNHLAGNSLTTFAVSNTTADAAADLVMTSGLRDGSGDNVGAGGLIKTGAGTMLLAGADSYTGDTLVNEGTLSITTARTGAGSFTVADGATLVVSNNDNAASAPMSFLTLGTSGTATLAFAHVASPTVPVLNVPGGLYVNGANTIKIADATGLTATGIYPLVAYGASLSGSVPALAPLPAGVTATLTNDTVNGWIALAVTAVPAPVDPNPTNVLASISGSNLVLSWPASHTGWTLQAQTSSLATGLSNNTNAWFDVPGSALTNQVSLPVDQANPAVFYRLRLGQ